MSPSMELAVTVMAGAIGAALAVLAVGASMALMFPGTVGVATVALFTSRSRSRPESLGSEPSGFVDR